MKKLILSAAITISAFSAVAQTEKVDYEYKNNTFSIAEQDQKLRRNSTGEIFYKRLKSFNDISKKSLKKFMSREQFYAFLKELEQSSEKASQNGYNSLVSHVQIFYRNIKDLSRLSTQDAYRFRLYEIAAPVHKVIDESWGNDISEAVIDEAYLNLYEYIMYKATSEPAFANAPKYLNIDPIRVQESAGQCLYSVEIDEPVLKKDNIEVYFTDLQVFNKVSKKYTGSLLAGPIPGWEARAEESVSVKAMLDAYAKQKEIPAYNIYAYNLKAYGNPSTVQQNLYRANNWFIWVFRNGVLYYSYMAIPCSKVSKCTVYEERPVEGLDDVGNSYQY